MDDVYENLNNYEDVVNIDELKSENKGLKDKIEVYTITIDKLQRDFDKLAAEHKKLEHNYSSLLKTARAEIERKTEMIKQLNIEKDKLIISARQNMMKGNNRYKRIETIKSKNNKSSDSSIQGPPDEIISKIHNSIAYGKNENVPSAHSFINGKTGPNIDTGRNNLHTMKNEIAETSVPKENDMQALNKLDNRYCETRLKKISNRRKSMPVLSSNDIKFSTDEDCENSIESEVSKKNYQTRAENVKRYDERKYNGNRISETSSIENYSRHHDTFTDNYSTKRTNHNKSRDRYESSYRKREKHSPERSHHTGSKNYGDNYYQRYDYGSSRAYESPPCEKSYHNSRNRDRKSNYDRDRSRDCIRNRIDDERYVEKHKHLGQFDEPDFKRQKFEHGYRYTQDYNRWQKEQDYTKRTIHAPLELREQFSCQSPDHIYNDYIMPTDPIKEIKYTANVPLEDPRLTSKKYKTITCSDKKFITTVAGRNVDILPVNKTAWGFVHIPMPKLLLEPPQSDSEKLNINVNMVKHNPSSYNLRKTSPSSHKFVNRSDLQKNNVMPADRCGLLKCVQKSAVNKTVKNNNSTAGLESSLGNNKKTDETIEAQKDNVLNENICDSIHINVLKEILKVSSKTNFTQEPNSILKLNSNPLPLKNENNVDKDMIQNIHSVKSLGNTIKNTKTEETTGANINEDNECQKTNLDMAIVSISNNVLDERSTSNSTKEVNSMPNLNPISTKEENNVNKEIIKNNHDMKNNEPNYIEDKHYDVLTNNVEDDLILSDETSDAYDSNQISSKKDIKTKLKKKEEIKSCNNNESDIIRKAEDFVDKKKYRVVKDKETSPEQTKKQRSKKKALENKGSDSDQSKAIKTKKSKKEKDTKTEEIKSKFSELFGDSTSLISTDDLGVVIDQNDINNKYDTIFEDTQAAVDLNLKEIDENETSILVCQKVQRDSLNEKMCVQGNFLKAVPNCGTIDDSNCVINEEIESKNTVVHDKVVTDAKFVLEDTLSLPNINGKMEESPDVVKMVIISSGMQPQNIIEDNDVLPQSFNDQKNIITDNVVKSTDKPIQIVALHALATSTPARTFADSTIIESVVSKPQDISSSTNSANSNVLSSPLMDQLSGAHRDSQKSEDVPDVRIFVKRRRKVRK